MTENNRRQCCCGTLAQQQKRVARFTEQIEKLSGATNGDSRKQLHHAQVTKARIEKWIAAHVHPSPATKSSVMVYRQPERAMMHGAGNGA